jgi:hypothetical protein
VDSRFTDEIPSPSFLFFFFISQLACRPPRKLGTIQMTQTRNRPMPPSRGYTRRSRTVFGTMTCATRSKREVALIQWELPFHSVGVLLPFFYSFFSFGELLISQSGSVGIVDFGCSIATLTRCNTYKHYVMDLQFFASPPPSWCGSVRVIRAVGATN